MPKRKVPGVDTHWSSGRPAEGGGVSSEKLIPDELNSRILRNPRGWRRPEESSSKVEDQQGDTGDAVKETLEK